MLLMQEELILVTVAAKEVDFSASTINGWLRSGELNGEKIKGKWYVRMSELRNYITRKAEKRKQKIAENNKPVEATNFYKLPWNKQIDFLVKHFIGRCTNEQFTVNGKLNPAYFAIRRTLEKEPVAKMGSMYEYLMSLPDSEEDKVILSLTEFYRNAEHHRLALIAESNRQKLKTLDVKDNGGYGITL